MDKLLLLLISLLIIFF